MQRDTIHSLLIGIVVGLVALGIHALTDTFAPRDQLLALVVSGAMLFAIHLAISLRRARLARERVESADADHEPETFLRDRRSPFFRELTRDWTGLDERSSAVPPSPAGTTPETRDKRPSDATER